MTKQTEALRTAIEAMELHGNQYPHMVKGYILDAIQACKEALEQPTAEQSSLVQEPMIIKQENGMVLKLGYDELPNGTAFYTTLEQFKKDYLPNRVEEERLSNLLKQTQEPVALSKLLHQVIHGDFNGDNTDDLRLALNARNELLALIHPPPSREWQSLSDEEIEEATGMQNQGFSSTYYMVIRAIEAKLREKNNG